MAGRKISHLGNLMTKQKASATPWLKNAVRSIGLTYVDVFKDLAPNMYEIGSASSRTLSDLARTVRSNTNQGKGVMNALNNNNLIKVGKAAINNSIKDLKSGDFGPNKRFTATGDDGFGDFDFDEGTFFDDWGEEESVQINNISTGSNEIAIAVGAEINKGNIANLKAQKAHLDSMVAIASANMMQAQTIGNNVLTELGNISSGISALVEFNNSTMAGFIEKATGYMEKMGKQTEDYFSGSSDKVRAGDLIGSGGRFSANNYVKLVQQNAKSFFSNSTGGQLASLVAENADMLLANPIAGLTKIALSQMTPKTLKKTIESFDEAIGGFIPMILQRFATWVDDPGFGFGAMVKRAIGSIFGVKNKRTKEFDLSGKINADPVPFDKITRHTIIEVIPKYLSEQVALTKELVKALGGNIKAINNAERFDVNEGRYRNAGNIRREIYGRIRQTTVNEMRSSKFGERLQDYNPRYMKDKNGNPMFSEADSNRFNDMLNEFFVQLEKHGKYINIEDQSKGSDLDNVLKATGYSEKDLNYLRAALRDASKRDKTFVSRASSAMLRSTAARNDLIASMQNDPSMYGLYSADLTKNIDDAMSEVLSSTFGDTDQTKKNGTIGEILNDIRYILNRGINVKIDGNGTYAPYGGGSSTTRSSNIIVPSTSQTRRTSSTPSGSISGEQSSVDYYNEIFQREMDAAESDKDQAKRTNGHLVDALRAMSMGSGRQMFEELSKIVGDRLVDLGHKVNDSFLTPLKESVFGVKDERGYSRDGLFSGIQNKFLDTYKSFMRDFDGRAYIDSKGTLVKAKEDGEPTVLGNIKSTVSDIKNSMMDYLFGEKDAETGKRKYKEGNIVGKMVGSLHEGFEGWKEALFGKQTEEERNKTEKSIREKMVKTLPATVTGGIGGAVFGAMSGGSLLGALIGGPIGGAVIGGIGGILSQSDRFKDWMFGSLDEETGERAGGMVSKNVQDFFKKNKKVIIGGAAFGAVKSAFTGGGVLGSIVGGPIAGALLGSGIAIVTKSEMFHDFLYGKEGTWHKGIIPMFNSIFKKKDKETGEESVSGSRLAGMGAIGALGGALTAGLVGKMGLLGAMATPFGPIGGALAGLALSMKASSGSFHEWLFGKDTEDGKHKAGILEKFGNMLDIELFQPMKSGLANFVDDTRNFIIDKMMAPIEFAIEPFAKGLANLKDSMTEKIHNFMDTAGKAIKEGVIDPLVDNVRKFIVSPMKLIFGTMFKAITGVAKTVVSAPFSALAVATNFMDARNKRDSRRRVMHENREEYGFFGGLRRNMGIRLHMGDAYTDASYKYTDYAGERDERKRLYLEDRANRRQAQKDARQNRRNRDWNLRQIGRILGYTTNEDTAENRAMAEALSGKRIKWREVKGNEVVGGGATDNNIVNNADNPKSEPQNRILGYLIKLYRYLTGQRTGGSDNLESPFASPDEVRDQKRTESTTGGSSEERTEETPDVAEEGAKSGLFARIKAGYQGSYLQSLVGRGRRAGSGIRSQISKFANKFGIKQFAGGGETDDGWSITGENGPELSIFPRGTQIVNGMKAIPVMVQGYAKTATDKIKSTITNVIDKPTDAESDYSRIKKAGSYETLMKEKEAEEQREYRKKMLEQTEEGNKQNKKHFDLWSFIFSKKGLITGGLLALSPFLLKFFKLNWGDIANNLLNALGNFGSKVINDLIEGQGQVKDADTTGERIDENIDELETLAKTGDLYGYIFPDGQVDHSTGAKLNALAHLPSYVTKGAKWLKTGTGVVPKLYRGVTSGVKSIAGGAADLGKGVVKGVKGAANVISDVAATSKAYGGVRNMIATTQSFKGTGVGQADTFAGAFRQTAENVGVDMKSTIGKSADEATDAAAKNSKSIIQVVKSALTSVWTKISTALTKHGGKVGQKSVTLIDDVVKALAKHAGKLSAKLAPVLAKTGALASTVVGLAANEAVGFTVGAVNGATGAARLFQTDDPDMWMTVISTAIGGFTGTTIGSIVDIVNEFIVDIMGFDFIHEIACFAYNLVAGEDKYQKLLNDIEANKEMWSADRNADLSDQYATYKQIHGLTDDDLSYDDFVNKVSSNEVDVSLQSYADWNDERHMTLGGKITRGFNKFVGQPVRSGLSSAKNFLVGGTKSTYTDANGFSYVESKDHPDAYDVINSSGETIGYISKGELQNMIDRKEINVNTTTSSGVLGKAWSGIKGAGSAIATGAKNFGAGFIGAAKDVGSAAKNFGGTIAGGVGKLFSGAGNMAKTIGQYGMEAAKGVLQGRKEIEDNFKNTDLSFLDYFKADIDTGMSDENPLKGPVDLYLNVSKVPIFIQSWIRGVFKNLAEKAKDVLDDLIKAGQTTGNDLTTGVKAVTGYVAKGDVAGLVSYKPGISDDNVLGTFTNVALQAAKIPTFIPTIISAGGHALYDLVSTIVDKAKQMGTAAVGDISSYGGYIKSGDLEGLSNHESSISDDVPLSGVVKAISGGIRTVAYIPTAISAGGHKIGEIISSIIDTAKSLGSDISKNHSSIVEFMKAGDLTGLHGYSVESSNEGVLGWVSSAIGGVEKMFMHIPTAAFAFGNGVKDAFSSFKTIGANVMDNLKAYASEAQKYTKADMDPDDFKKVKFSSDDTDPVNNVVGAVAGKVLGMYVGIMNAVNKFGETMFGWMGDAKDWVEDKLEWAGDKAEGAKKWVGDRVEDVDNVLTGIMSWGRGGRGRRRRTGGRGNEISIPYYSQNDPRWGNLSYGDESMSEAGCGPTAMAMVASGFGGSTSPMAMANYAKSHGFRDDSGTGWGFIESSSKSLGLSSNKQYMPSANFIDSQLSQGNPVILSGQGGLGSPYTSAGHYVVATGKDRYGNVMINDPRGPEYSGAYPMSSVSGGANVGWGISRGGRGKGRHGFKVVTGGRGANESDARRAVCATMMALQNKLNYTQDSRRETVMQAFTKGTAAGDCSSTCRHIYKDVLGLEIGTYTGAQIKNSNGIDVDTNTGGIPDESKLLPGDLLFFGKKGSLSEPGHVEMYMGNNTLMGHGGPNWGDVGPSPKKMTDYCANRNNAGKKYLKTRRYIHDNNVSSIRMPSSAAQFVGQVPTSGTSSSSTDAVTSTTTSSGGILDTISNVFSQIGQKAWTGALTGVWDYDFTSATSGNLATAGLYSDATTSTTANIPGNSNQEKVWNYLIGKGIPATGVGALMGNLYAESGINPTNMENQYEKKLGFNDNTYTAAVDSGSYKNFSSDRVGYGLAQWTSGDRKSGLLSSAKSSNKSIGDLGLQLDYLYHELENSYSTTLNALKTSSTLRQASDYVLTKFERPADQSEKVKQKRASFGQSIYNNYANKTGGGRGGIGTAHRARLNRSTYRPASTTSITNGHRIQSGFGGYGAFYNSSNRYRGGRGPAGETEELLRAMVGILENIANATISSDQKLNLLRNISSTGNQLNVNMGNRNPIVVTGNGSQQVVSPMKSRSESVAMKIAQGF